MSALIGHSNGIQDATPPAVVQNYVTGGIVVTARGKHSLYLTFEQARTISRRFLDSGCEGKFNVTLPLANREEIYVAPLRLNNMWWIEIGKSRQLRAAPCSEKPPDDDIKLVFEKVLLTPNEMVAKVREWAEIGIETPQPAGRVQQPQTRKEASLR